MYPSRGQVQVKDQADGVIMTILLPRDYGNDYSDDEGGSTAEDVFLDDDGKEKDICETAICRTGQNETLADIEAWQNIDNKVFNVSEEAAPSHVGMFRSSGGLKKRGFFHAINKDPDKLPHKAHPDDPK